MNVVRKALGPQTFEVGEAILSNHGEEAALTVLARSFVRAVQNVNTHTRADRNGHEHTTTCDRQTESGDDATKKEKRKPIEHGAGGG